MSEIVRPDDLRRQNRAKVLAALRASEPLSRTAIGQKTGLSAATISAITGDLLAEEVLARVEEGDQTRTARGRPRVALTFNRDFASIGIVVLQMNKITISITDYRGETIFQKHHRLATRALSADQLLQEITRNFKDAFAASKCPAESLKHIAVGVQGTTDVENTMLLWSPITTDGNVPIQMHLTREIDVPVSVHNDCNMIARALRWGKDDLSHTDFAAILLSHGIGMGLYHNGELIKGKLSSATEFGHMRHMPDGALCRCGRRGCIEAYAGDYSIYRRATNEAPTSPPQDNILSTAFEAIIDSARAGEADAVQAFNEAGSAIGSGLASLFALIDPCPVVFVGRGAMAPDLLEKQIMNAIGDKQPIYGHENISFRYYPDEYPLIQRGCAITALMEVDGRRNYKSQRENNMALQNAE